MDKQVTVTFAATGRTRPYNVAVLLGVQGNQIMSANPFHVSRVGADVTDEDYRKLAVRYNLQPRHVPTIKPVTTPDEPEAANPQRLAADESETTTAAPVLNDQPAPAKRGRKPKNTNQSTPA
jgi:hypothetical protein